MAAIGTLTMLFGALLVIAPAASAAHNEGHVPGPPPGAGTPGNPNPGNPNPNIPDPNNNGGTRTPQAECAAALAHFEITPDSYAGAKWDGNPDYTWTTTSADSTYNGFVAEAQATVGVDGDGADVVVVDFRGEDAAEVTVAAVKQASGEGEYTYIDTFTSQAAVGEEPAYRSFVFPGDDLSHFSLCSHVATVTPQATTLEIVKAVAGAPVPAEWSFSFTGLPGAKTALTSAAPSTGAVSVTPNQQVTITETGEGAALFTGFACTDAVVTDGAGPEVTVSVAEGKAAKCTFTNTYKASGGNVIPPKPKPKPEPKPKPTVNPATVVIREVVVGTPAHKVPAGWAFGFTSELTEGADEISAAARKVFELGEDAPETTFTVEPGSSLNVAQDEVPEVDGGVWSFLGTECTGTDADDVTGDGQAITVTPDADDVIACTFTTEFTALAIAPAPGPAPAPAPEPTPAPAPKPNVNPPAPVPTPNVTSTPTPAPAPTPTEVLGEKTVRTPTPEVLGVQANRLATTGQGSFGLAGFGLILLTLGGVLVAASRLGRLGEG